MGKRVEAVTSFASWRDLAGRRPQWLDRVSPDGTEWIIRDLLDRDKPARLNLNVPFPNGTSLTSPAYASFLDVVRTYVPLLRLHMPRLSCKVHAERVTSLLSFLFWLQLQGVRRLEDVTRHHVGLYVDGVRYGREWSSEAAHRVLNHLRVISESGKSLALIPMRKGRIVRRALYEAAGASWPGGGYRYRAAVVNWFEGREADAEWMPDLQAVLAQMKVRVRPVTQQAVHRFLEPIEDLWLWREHFPPGHRLPFKPFDRGSAAVAGSVGVESKRHRSLPPETAFRFLNYCARWVTELSPLAADWGTVYAAQSGLRSRLEGLTPLRFLEEAAKVDVARRRIGPEGVVRLLSSACFALIAVLTARRLGEVLELEADRVTEDPDGGWWLRVYIEKTLQGYDMIPIPSLVVEAIRCMERLSKGARTAGDGSIWQWRRPDGTIRRISPQKDLNHLAGAGAADVAHGNWKFAPHQFRRFFALLYFWRYDKPNLPALSSQLRHFDLEMTRRYVTESSFLGIEHEARGEYETEFLRDVVHGRRKVSGHAGERLNAIVGRLTSLFRKRVTVLPEDAVIGRLKRLGEKWGADFKQHVWGTICACPKSSSAAKLARCRDGAPLGPVYANATESKCGVCRFAIHTERFQEAADAACKGALNRAALAPDSILGDVARGEVERLELIMREGRPPPGSVEAIGQQQ